MYSAAVLFPIRNRKEFLLVISNDLPCESGLETRDDLIPGPKLFTLGPFSIISKMVAYGSNSPQNRSICQSRTVIKSVLWLVSNG